MAKKSDEEYKAELSEMQYWVAREGGTERPFTGIYNAHDKEGVYKCVCCHAELFASGNKFESGCGWPSFADHMDNENLRFLEDASRGMVRTEVRCAGCDAHLGHVFDDGPTETGQRYCINSAALSFADDSDT
ncbi:MAG: peptide-methionine (R)-S-oxide reductase MsrB [Myxococcales bacterium]|nr:peptide-methionine (R)-S-oxide reductase MsrB [Myxococcales bacterium]